MNANAKFVSTLLKYTFGLVPIIAGLDKFTNILVDWTIYLSPGMVELLPFTAAVFMGIVGVVEIGAGILVLVKPSICFDPYKTRVLFRISTD